MHFFDIHHTFFTIWGYEMSYLEFIGAITGAIAVALSAIGHVWSWPLGIINVVLSFLLFFQVQLYPDMFLQVFFFVTNVIGWWRWTHPRPGEEDRNKELRISFMERRQLVVLSAVGILGTFCMGAFAENLHELFPAIFSKPSAAPYLDSFVTVMSIIATFLLIQKKIEAWIIWWLVDVIATYLYFVRDIKFYSFLYLVFCGIAAFALWNWVKECKSYQPEK
jgi:nicotinamide mononucleotide transporter